jgi:hypothetical protein
MDNMRVSHLVRNKSRTVVRLVRQLAVAGTVSWACTTNDPRESHVSRSVVVDVIVSVDNQTSRPMTIYLDAGAMHDSLGVVLARSTRSFSLPSGASDSTNVLTLEARERWRGSGVRSGEFRLTPGHQVVWTLEKAGTTSVTMR